MDLLRLQQAFVEPCCGGGCYAAECGERKSAVSWLGTCGQRTTAAGLCSHQGFQQGPCQASSTAFIPSMKLVVSVYVLI